ncbi:glycerophosphodiester phosphodiesterase [Nocardioides sp. JQ2195]|uniref:glycerophosphodiester phosphodiesterase n=1 Tax=Nocardioides sp. JQ2195 TaxID=2592334 RepID=UPI00143EF1ED|nr:glycerophosphodiester phosphodiesterase [Nocardioides sp. JQ2195]QIX27186.1 glycerophosphodiester phosphodiesterase [Nocardioides sp. JQ2195]
MSVLAIAHRAGNSLTGLHEANALGVDVIECDIHRHRDRLEVRHLKTAGPLPFLWDRWELVPASAPRLGLHELLEADRHGTTFMLDLKGIGAGVGTAVVRLLADRSRAQPVLVCGRNWSAVTAVAELDQVRPVLSARKPRELTALWKRVGTGGFHGASVHCTLLDRNVVERLRSHVELVMTWPVNDLSLLDRMVDIGVNGIISDEPSVLAELIRRQRA